MHGFSAGAGKKRVIMKFSTVEHGMDVEWYGWQQDGESLVRLATAVWKGVEYNDFNHRRKFQGTRNRDSRDH
jgi:hypothetical protein